MKMKKMKYDMINFSSLAKNPYMEDHELEILHEYTGYKFSFQKDDGV